jgi:asparagine N-glycosylation enzyme membrane subunit Stt3
MGRALKAPPLTKQPEVSMKSIVKAAVLAAVIAVPAISFAQAQQQPLTRAQVREQLVQLRAAGYDPHDWIHYPDNIQAAEARVAQQQAANSAYGPSTNGTSQAGQ